MPSVVTDQLGKRRKALLVIHGIGDQPPLRVLGAFVEGLWRAGLVRRRGADGTGGAPAARVQHLAGKARPVVRLPRSVLGDAELDLLEYHWAEHAVGGMSAAATFAWLLEVVVAGLDFRRQVPFLMAGTRAGNAWALVLRQLLQVAGLIGAASALLVAALTALARAGEALPAVRAAVSELPELPSLPVAAALGLLLCLATAVAVLA